MAKYRGTRRRLLRTRGGFMSPRPRTNFGPATERVFQNMKRAAYNYGKPLLEQGVATASGILLNKAYSAVKDFTKSSSVSVEVVVPKNLLPSKNTSAPTVYGAYGNITRTKYREGSYYIPSYIKSQAKLVRHSYETRGILLVGGAQATFDDQICDGADLKSIADTLFLFDTAPVGAATAMPVYIQRADVETRISNSSNSSATIDLYEIVPRRDVPANGVTNVTVPISAWNTGLATQAPYNGMALTSITTGQYYSDPRDSQLFTSFYLIKKKFSVELPAGASHVHKSQYNINTMMPRAIVNNTNFSATNSQIVGFTKNIMYVLRGTPAFESATPTTVSTAPTGVDVVMSVKITAYSIPDSNIVVGRVNNLGTLTTPLQYPATAPRTTITNN